MKTEDLDMKQLLSSPNKKIASLDVVMLWDPKGKLKVPEGSFLSPGEKNTIFLNPFGDKKIFERMTGKEVKTAEEGRELLSSTLAHELGHFVSHVLHDPVETTFFTSVFGNVPAEKKAWEIAEQITPIRQDVKKAALGSYTDTDRLDSLLEKLEDFPLPAVINAVEEMVTKLVKERDAKNVVEFVDQQLESVA